MKIALLGIGLMGFPMGRRLCEAGHTVHVWNRTPATLEPARAELAAMLLRRLDAVLSVRASKLVLFQAARDAVPALLELLPDAEPPTVMAIEGQRDQVALQALCRSAMTWQRLEDMKRAGATGLLVLNLFGGPGTLRAHTDTHRVTPRPRLPGEAAIPPFDYLWEQRAADPQTQRIDCRIKITVLDAQRSQSLAHFLFGHCTPNS